MAKKVIKRRTPVVKTVRVKRHDVHVEKEKTGKVAVKDVTRVQARSALERKGGSGMARKDSESGFEHRGGLVARRGSGGSRDPVVVNGKRVVVGGDSVDIGRSRPRTSQSLGEGKKKFANALKRLARR